MRYGLSYRRWHFYVGLTSSQQAKGVNSKLLDGRHFLMWDFDNVEVEDVKEALVGVQRRFELPKIYLVNTGLARHYHAYCFKALPFPDILFILASTPLLDEVYFKIGVIRGYYTLRYSPKKGRDFSPATILPSRYEEDISPFELTNFSKYWARRV